MVSPRRVCLALTSKGYIMTPSSDKETLQKLRDMLLREAIEKAKHNAAAHRLSSVVAELVRSAGT